MSATVAVVINHRDTPQEDYAELIYADDDIDPFEVISVEQMACTRVYKVHSIIIVFVGEDVCFY